MFFSKKAKDKNLSNAKIGQTVQIKRVEGKDKVKNFLTTLGCFEGESITLISILAGNYVINIKDSRYAIDSGMAKSILIEA
jgi:ferrous iron transport protein A